MRRHTSYKPEPVDTFAVSLSPEVRELVELLARNTHEVWAQQRQSEGWHYGPKRSDDRKEHPCLVPYEELPEHEKEMDRQVALQMVKAMLAFGYRIEPPR